MGAARFPADSGYSVMGTSVFPFAVALFLGVVSAGIVLQALTGGLRNLDEPEGSEPATRDARAGAAWVSAAVLLDALLIERVGFVLAASLLFVLCARGFGSGMWLRNCVVALAISLPVYWGFANGLGISLPRLFNHWI
ncbi:Tripartite tricarboxylate transporter TctB family [Cupriavidus taiwanensis]|nr:Tripartite tricarboxylate transporter TctB family [Cupriavidus taiwanensis]SOY63106.1 Tripartite tricarboxylate transporter TctB family [Cupriavidus taiwanensis]SOY98165.1 Tripartite tricarboxylate transporter TctB family [Cupriavidus taiwanensis]SOZ85232.1 Tripartite tricarboxylate transporter TctB family [Cupriavidus taiwanensis]SOZ88689.1 Tripartite tricarboxylate transporter TctB family [Cupriavidus taiwanensis]